LTSCQVHERTVVRDEGDSVNNERHKQHPQRRQLLIVKTFARTSPSYSRNTFDRSAWIFLCHAKRAYTARNSGQEEIGGRLSKEDKARTSGGNDRFWRDPPIRIDGGRPDCGRGRSDSTGAGPLRMLWRPRRGEDRSSEKSNKRPDNRSLAL
jgi:hypothetical protein